MKKFVLIFVVITILNGFNDILYVYHKTDEVNWAVFIYGAVHFVTFGGAYYWILTYVLRTKESK